MSYQNPHLSAEAGNIDSLISTIPIALDSNRPEVIEAGIYYLPYSTGFEIECDQDPNYKLTNFTTIPNIMDVNNSSSEQRYRIPNGILGLQCLYNISQQLKLNSLLNEGSGIHYHIDCTDIFDSITDEDITEYKDIILKRLDKWEYKGTYNRRDVTRSATWIRVSGEFKTLEFRIGEMTFDYDLLFKRITDANDIVRDFKAFIIRKALIRSNVSLAYELEDLNEVLNNRTKKI